MKRVLISLEGVKDQEFVTRTIEAIGVATQKSSRDEVDGFFKKLLSSSQLASSDIYKRIPLPFFLSSEYFSIALINGGGENQFEYTKVQFKNNPNFLTELDGFIMIKDKDNNNPGVIERRIRENCDYLENFPDSAGTISLAKVNSAFWIFPDANTNGALEDVLISITKLKFTQIHNSCKILVETCPVKGDQCLRGSAAKKALIGSTVQLLRPGLSLPVSLRHDTWIDENVLTNCPFTLSFSKFLREFFEKL